MLLTREGNELPRDIFSTLYVKDKKEQYDKPFVVIQIHSPPTKNDTSYYFLEIILESESERFLAHIPI